jgi:hypothetical protein
MSNHLHLVLRNRPDVVRSWSDAEVARRWWNVFPKRKDKDGKALEPTGFELQMFTFDPERLAEIRSRLSNVSSRSQLFLEAIDLEFVTGNLLRTAPPATTTSPPSNPPATNPGPSIAPSPTPRQDDRQP